MEYILQEKYYFSLYTGKIVFHLVHYLVFVLKKTNLFCYFLVFFILN